MLLIEHSKHCYASFASQLQSTKCFFYLQEEQLIFNFFSGCGLKSRKVFLEIFVRVSFRDHLYSDKCRNYLNFNMKKIQICWSNLLFTCLDLAKFCSIAEIYFTPKSAWVACIYVFVC